MTTNNYIYFPTDALVKLHYALRDTLSIMAGQYPDLAIIKDADLTSYNNALSSIRQEYDKVNKVLDDYNITPRRDNETAMLPTEIHY